MLAQVSRDTAIIPRLLPALCNNLAVFQPADFRRAEHAHTTLWYRSKLPGRGGNNGRTPRGLGLHGHRNDPGGLGEHKMNT